MRVPAVAVAVALVAAVVLASCAPPGHAVREEPVRITTPDGIVLAGVLSRPASTSGSRTPVVVVVSGSGAQDRDGARRELPGYRPFHDLAQALAERGVGVLRLDDRGTGESTGQFEGATTRDFARDVEATLQWLRWRPDVDGTRPMLLGHSEGAVVALLAAAADSTVSALVLLGAPSRTGREIARWQRTSLVASDGAAWPPSERAATLARAEAEAERLAAHDAWMRAWFALDPRAVARDVRAPALLLHGDTDGQVPAAQSAELAAALREGARRAGRRPDVSVRRFPSTDHLFLEDHDGDPRGYVRLGDRRVRREVLDAIGAWIARRTREP